MNVKLTASEKYSFNIEFAYECLSAKVLADADPIAVPTKKNGAHPVHLKGRERSIANKRFGAKAKKDRKTTCTRDSEWVDACNFEHGGEFSAKRRSTLIEEDYNPVVEEILDFYGAADINELLRFAEEAWNQSCDYDNDYYELRMEIEKKAAIIAADNLKKVVLSGRLTDPVWYYKNEYWCAKDCLEYDNAEELSSIRDSSKQLAEYSRELSEVYKYIVTKLK